MKNKIGYYILLQLKFLLVEFLNSTYSFIPIFLRNYYLKLFSINVKCSSVIHRGVKFFHIGKLIIDSNSVVNFNCYLDNRRGIFIGKNVAIAHDTKIYTLGHDLNDPLFHTKGASVFIEDNVFIFSNCLIMPGVRISEGAIVLPGSVVIKDVKPFYVVGGNPARFIKLRNKDILYKNRYQYMFAL